MNIDLAILIAALLFLAGEALLSALETAALALGAKGLKRVQTEKPSLSRPLEFWIEKPGRALAALRMDAKVLSAAGCALAAVGGYRFFLFRPQLWFAAILAPLIYLGLEIVFCDVLPKTRARGVEERTVAALLGPARLMMTALGPLAFALSRAAGLAVPGRGDRSAGDLPLVTENLILTMVADGEAQGVIDEDEREMIDSVLEFGETTVKEVMVPRTDMTTLDADLTIDAAAHLMQEKGHSRIPVYEGGVDRIVGIITSKDLLKAMKNQQGAESVRGYLREPIFVPESKKLDDLLREFQQKRTHIAIIVDEYGGTSGLVTMEDLLEEIVGEIQDEFDTEEALVRKIGDGEFRVNAKINLEELNEMVEIQLPEDPEYETLGGYVYSRLERIPRPGEKIEHESADLIVETVTARRIKTIRLIKRDAGSNDREEASR